MYTICDPVLDSSPSFDKRYISPPDVLRDIFYLTTTTVVTVRLHVHLPHQHIIANQATTLTAYFKANADSGPLGEEARKHTYHDFPTFFVYNWSKHEWKLRQQGMPVALGRMDAIEPTAGELYFLRLLLTVVKGKNSDPLLSNCVSYAILPAATSFEDLRKVPGHADPLPTFQAACVARGLLEDDGDSHTTLSEFSLGISAPLIHGPTAHSTFKALIDVM